MEVDPPEPGEAGWFVYAPAPQAARAWQATGRRAVRANEALDPAIPLKLMPEYAVELPLWNHDWEDLGLPTGLLDDLADWQLTFDAHFDPEDGWGDDVADEAVKEAWTRRADELVTRLREALPDGISLEVDLWPLEHPGVDRVQR